MYSKIQLAFKYLNYYFTSFNGKGHGMHSPFVFAFITEVMNDKRAFYAYAEIEALRRSLLKNNRQLTIDDFGAGSRIMKDNQRSITSIASSSLKPARFGQLLFRMVNYYQPHTILELGTSLGITTSYLAAASSSARVITMEGALNIAAVAKENFVRLGLKNIKQVLGNFDETLAATVNSQPSFIDFAFLDGNHRYKPTMEYFRQILTKSNESSIIILDDIHWSKEMERAWQEVQMHPLVTLTIDLFFIGIVFFRKEFKVKQHFSIRF